MSYSVCSTVCFGVNIDPVTFKTEEEIEEKISEEASLKLEIVSNGTCEKSTYVLAVKESIFEIYTGYKENHDPLQISEKKDEWHGLIVDTCRDLGIQYIGHPAWYLCVYESY